MNSNAESGSEQSGFWRYEEAEARCLRPNCRFKVQDSLHRLRDLVDEHVGSEKHAVKIITETEQ